jgi:hypothetical protein
LRYNSSLLKDVFLKYPLGMIDLNHYSKLEYFDGYFKKQVKIMIGREKTRDEVTTMNLIRFKLFEKLLRSMLKDVFRGSVLKSFVRAKMHYETLREFIRLCEDTGFIDVGSQEQLKAMGCDEIVKEIERKRPKKTVLL